MTPFPCILHKIWLPGLENSVYINTWKTNWFTCHVQIAGQRTNEEDFDGMFDVVHSGMQQPWEPPPQIMLPWQVGGGLVDWGSWALHPWESFPSHAIPRLPPLPAPINILLGG